MLFSIVLCSVYATFLCQLAHNAHLLHALTPVVFVVVLCLGDPFCIGTTSISAVSKGLIEGIQVDLGSGEEFCETCTGVKLVRQLYPQELITRASTYGE